MALRGKKPAAVEKRLKVLFFGAAGSGKTTAAIQFPKPYLIDTERGAENDQYVQLLEESGGLYYHTTDFDEMVAEITSLLTTKHEMRTIIIDPLTVPYAAELDKEARRLANKEDPAGTAFGRNKQIPDRKVKHLLNLLLRLDMNVIITSHAKAEWKNGAPTGTDTFDCYNKLDYLFDLAIQIQKRGKDRVGIVKKTRCKGFEEGEVFPFTYADFAEKYGREVLEKAAKPEVLATAGQIAEITRLVEMMKIPAETTDKWLDKAMAESWAEMPSETIQTCINHLLAKVAA
jgi:RecA/RadA recombinase